MKTVVLFIIGIGLSTGCFAQADTICIKNNSLQTSNLTEGKGLYLSWLQKNKSGDVSNISMSERKIYFQKVNGKDEIVVIKRLMYNDSSMNRYARIVSKRSNFQTIYDYSRTSTTQEAYNFEGDEIKGADTIKRNSKSNFHLKFNNIPYSNELDLETIRALPIKYIGQKMAISFYQPGTTTLPKIHPLDVIGEERLAGINNVGVACWLIKLVFDSENYDLFWVDKQTHELLKFESCDPDETFYKIKIFNSDTAF